MGYQDLKRKLKSLREKRGPLEPKDRHDASESPSVESQAHQAEVNSNTSIAKGHVSSTDLELLNWTSKKQEGITPNSQSSEPSQTSAFLRSDDIPIKELWNVAFEKLRVEDDELIRKYEKKLRGNMVAALGSTIGSNANIRDQIQTILEYKMNEANANVWKLKFRSFEVEVRDLIQPILGIVSLANEHIADAASVNSFTSLAWVGISLLLPLFVNPSTQMASLAKGLVFISSLISQSRMREELYERRYGLTTHDDQTFQQSHREYKNGLERLYRQILRFQVTAYCYFTNDSASRLTLDIVKQNDWDQLFNGILEEENLFAKLATTWRDIQYDNECSAADIRHQETMNLWFTIEENISSLERIVKESQKQNDRADLLKWLCDVDHTELYNSARSKHRHGTGEWLIAGSETFKAWEESISFKSFLWLHGKAGSGKSVLSSSVIKHLQDRHKQNAMSVLAYFHFSFSDIQKQKVDAMLSSLIKQITAHRPYIPQAVQSLDEYKNKGGRPETKTLMEALIASMQGFSAVYIVIDALDECPMFNDERKKLLNSLRHILKKAPDSLHMLCTSRKEADIDKAIRPLLFEPWRMDLDLSIQRETLQQDIGQYIDSILADTEYDTWPDDIKKESRNALMEKADGMFQYVRCQFEILQKLSSVDAVRKALQDLPSGLDSTYDRMLQSIDTSFQPQVISSLKWLAFSIEPLDVDQLAEVFAFSSTSDGEFKMETRLFSSTDVLKYFPGLIITQETSARRPLLVRLPHFSIKEYLTSDRIVEGSASVFAFTDTEAHMHIGRFCLAYHLHISSTPRILELDESSKTFEYKLMSYASHKWAEHLEMIPSSYWSPDVSHDAILALSMRSQSLFIMTRRYRPIHDFIRRPYCFTTWRGFHQLTELLISTRVGASKYLTQGDLYTGLKYATSHVRTSIVKLFLEKGAQIHDCLENAVEQEDVALVSLLLDHGSKTDALAGKMEPALQVALWNGYLDILKLLVNYGADVNSPFNKETCMPPSVMSSSGRSGSADCLRLLFDNGAGVNMKDNYSLAAALYTSIHLGFTEASLLLLDRGANVNEFAGERGFPLQAAIHDMPFETDHWFINRLLDHGADPNAQAGIHNTALQVACATRYTLHLMTMWQVIELLIERGANVSIQGGKYGTALEAACWNEKAPIAVIKLLLGKGADVNAQGGFYGSALQAACQRGGRRSQSRLLPTGQGSALELVQILLNHGANVHAQGGYYGMALQAACAKEYKDVVRLLIDQGADVNAQGGRYGTALQTASATGNMELVQLLLDEGASVNIEAGYHGTAFQAACANGHIKVARVLIEHGADIHLRDNGAFHAAAYSGNDDLVRLLLDRGVDVNDLHGPHGSALQAVLRRAWNTTLWQSRDMNADGLESKFQHDDFNWTKMIRLLLERGADPCLSVGDFGTALHTACTVKSYLFKEDSDMFPGATGAKLLLNLCADMDVNAQGGLFGSALQAAAYSGQTPTISLLLSKGAHANAHGGKYGSALNAAVVAGHWDIVQILIDAGAIPDCQVLSDPDEEWLQMVLDEDGQGGVERYRTFWQVQKESSTEIKVSTD